MTPIIPTHWQGDLRRNKKDDEEEFQVRMNEIVAYWKDCIVYDESILTAQNIPREWWAYVLSNDQDTVGFLCEDKDHLIELIDSYSQQANLIWNRPVYKIWVQDGRDTNQLQSKLADDFRLRPCQYHEQYENWLHLTRHHNTSDHHKQVIVIPANVVDQMKEGSSIQIPRNK